MFDANNPEDVQGTLLHIAAASVGAPDRRATVERWLRAALALVEKGDPDGPPVTITPAVAKALEGLSQGLTNMADHAGLLAEEANEALMRQPPSRN